ncbi:hypothetical protein LIER_04324 [Lithospermum erythrorhizon]|uniref:Uncharacterized protein n=1 Tax=Lithospermum erythrorhizon TaxID=34254 RepID=A0AAV3NWB1_LITER
MLPMFLTFICLGVGKTYFVVQADSMNPKIGKWKVPLQVFQLIYDMSTKKIFNGMALKLKNFLKRLGLNKYAPPVTITMAIIFSVLRYVNAAKVESRRLHVIRTHNLLDKPDERIPMKVREVGTWLDLARLDLAPNLLCFCQLNLVFIFQQFLT